MKDTEPIQSRKQYPSNDRNGEPIFEGDFVKGVGKHVGQSEVFFDAGQWQPFSYLNDFDGNNYELVKHNLEPIQSVFEAAGEYATNNSSELWQVLEQEKKAFIAGSAWQAKQQQETENDFFHWSDCAVHNEPAMPTGKCDCEPMHRRTYLRTIEIAKQQQIVPEINEFEIELKAAEHIKSIIPLCFHPRQSNDPFILNKMDGFIAGYKEAIKNKKPQ